MKRYAQAIAIYILLSCSISQASVPTTVHLKNPHPEKRIVLPEIDPRTFQHYTGSLIKSARSAGMSMLSVYFPRVLTEIILNYAVHGNAHIPYAVIKASTIEEQVQQYHHIMSSGNVYFPRIGYVYDLLDEQPSSIAATGADEEFFNRKQLYTLWARVPVKINGGIWVEADQGNVCLRNEYTNIRCAIWSCPNDPESLWNYFVRFYQDNGHTYITIQNTANVFRTICVNNSDLDCNGDISLKGTRIIREIVGCTHSLPLVNLQMSKLSQDGTQCCAISSSEQWGTHLIQHNVRSGRTMYLRSYPTENKFAYKQQYGSDGMWLLNHHPSGKETRRADLFYLGTDASIQWQIATRWFTVQKIDTPAYFSPYCEERIGNVTRGRSNLLDAVKTYNANIMAGMMILAGSIFGYCIARIRHQCGGRKIVSTAAFGACLGGVIAAAYAYRGHASGVQSKYRV